MLLQLLHAEGKPNIFTSHTDEYWRLVRKGVAPAFSPKNIRYAPQDTRHGSKSVGSLPRRRKFVCLLCDIR